MKLFSAILLSALLLIGCASKPEDSSGSSSGNTPSTTKAVDVVGKWNGMQGGASKPGNTADFRADGSYTMAKDGATAEGKFTVEGNHVNLMIESLNGMSVPTAGTSNSRGLDVAEDGKTMTDSGGTGDFVWQRQ